MLKLEDPSDFQAVLCGERALFETTLDIVLIAADPSAPEKIIEWEESAKLKQAELGTTYLLSEGKGLGPYSPWTARLDIAADIKAKRQKRGWPKHPDRWTGPGHNLARDAAVGDKLQQRFRFAEWYETRYRFVCWIVHGSALVTRMIPPENYPGSVGLSLKFSGDLAREAARSTVEAMGWLSDEYETAFRQLDERRLSAFADANPDIIAMIRRRRSDETAE